MAPQQVWLITGTSAGFGRDLAIAALKRGEKVIATARARSIGRLDDLKKQGADILELDVTVSLDDLRTIAAKAIAIHGQVDVVVNNAGYMEYAAIEENTPEETFKQFNTNVFGALNVARVFLAHMRERRTGTIVWLGSIAGWSGVKGASLYCASKHAVRAISQALDDEVKPLGIRSFVVEPGYFRTNFLEATSRPLYTPRIDAYGEELTKMEQMFAAYNGKQPGNPAKAVEIILDIVRNEGVAQGRELPDALVLGTDAAALLKGILKKRLEIVEEWEEVSKSADVWD